jgi:hypothetical protein
LSVFGESLLLILPVLGAGLCHQLVRATRLFECARRPIDDLLFGGRLVFGRNKTLRGFIVVPIACALTFGVEDALGASLPGELGSSPVLGGLLVGLAYCGFELPNSFIKRRTGIAPGARAVRLRPIFFFADHLDSAIGCAVVFRSLGVAWSVVACGLALAPGLHVLVNVTMHRLHLREAAR